jgi:hypothetical protein
VAAVIGVQACLVSDNLDRRMHSMNRFMPLMAVALLALPAVAEGPPEFVVKGSLKGSEVPEFYRYKMFFQFAHEALSDPDEDFRRYYLGEVLALPENKQAVALFRVAVEEAWEVITDGQEPEVSMNLSNEGEEAVSVTTSFTTGPKMDDFASEEAYQAASRAQELAEARKIGRVLGELEAAFETEGLSAAGIHRYVSERLAAGTSLIASEELTADHHIFQVEHSFDAAREAARRAGGAR